MNSRFSSMASLTVKPVIQATYLHPFIQELIDGILSRERFYYFLQQDSLYLNAYARSMTMCAAKMHSYDDMDAMLALTEKALCEERDLHAYYFLKHKLSPAEYRTPACFSFCSHLLARAALDSPAEGLASLAPCVWMYREVGGHVRKMADADNEWARWIESYSNDSFSEVVERTLELLDRLADNASNDERRRMMEGFIISCRYIYAFWDDAYHMRAWPV